MAVVYLPPDPRQTALSQGIQALAGKLAQKKKQSQLAQILQTSGGDISKALPQLVAQGPEGTQLAGVLSQLATAKATQQRAQAETAKTNEEASLIKPKFLLDSLKTQSELSLNHAKQAEAQATTLKAQAEAATEPARRAQLQAEAEKATVEAQNLKNSATMMAPLIQALTGTVPADQQGKPQQASTTGTPQPAVPTMNDVLGDMNPAEKLALGMSAASGKPQNVAETLGKIETAKQPKPLPGDAAKIAGNASATANNLGQVLDAVGQGQITGGPIDNMLAYAQDHGWIKPGMDRASALEAVHQLTYNRATAGGGFGGQWKINISKDTLPNFRKGPAQNILSAAVIAQDTLSDLMAQKKRFTGTKVVTDSLDTSIKQMQDIIKRANTLKVDKSGNVFFDGKILQGKNGYSPSDLMPAGQTVSIGTRKFTSDQLNTAAINRGVTVRDIITTIRQHETQETK